jgi:hypothetical protein
MLRQLTSRQQRMLLAIVDAHKGTFSHGELADLLGWNVEATVEIAVELSRLDFVNDNATGTTIKPAGRQWADEHRATPLVVPLSEHQRRFLLAVSDAPDGRLIQPKFAKTTGLTFTDAYHIFESLRNLGLVYHDAFGVKLTDAGHSAADRVKRQPEQSSEPVRVEIVNTVPVDAGANMNAMGFRLNIEEFQVLTFLHEHAESFDEDGASSYKAVSAATYLAEKQTKRAISSLASIRLVGRCMDRYARYGQTENEVNQVYLVGAGEQFMRALEEQLVTEIEQANSRSGGGTPKKLTIKAASFVFETGRPVIVKTISDYLAGRIH